MDALDTSTALIVLDLQAGTLGNAVVNPAEVVLAHANELVAAFRAAGRPVVLASVTGMPAGRTTYSSGARAFPDEFSALAIEPQPGDIVQQRATWDAFAGTDLEAELRGRAVTQVVLVGLATSFGIESTARRAYDLGFSVVIVTDAISDPRAEAHENSVSRIFPALGQLGSTAEVLALLG